MRFTDAKFFDVNIPIYVVGCGAVGSYLIPLLRRQIGSFDKNKPLTVVDPDSIAPENIGLQNFDVSDIGENKAEHFTKYADAIPMKVTANNSHIIIDPNKDAGFIIISSVDNVISREVLLHRYCELKEDGEKGLLIDTRMYPERFELLTVHDEESLNFYKETLPKESELLNLSCSYTGTPHTASLAASYIASIVANYKSNIKLGDDIKEIPGYLDIDLSSFTKESKDVSYDY